MSPADSRKLAPVRASAPVSGGAVRDTRAIDVATLEERPCPPLEHELRVVLAEEVFDRAVARGAADLTREIGGVLVGELLRDAGGPYLQVTSAIDALHAEEKGAELTFTHATWEHIHGEMDRAHEGKKLVGWYHTHPGFGVFLSDRDQFIHGSFFDLPFQVAFVYDPKSREHGMFAWRDGEAARLRRYWIGARAQLWDGARVATPRREGQACEPSPPALTELSGPSSLDDSRAGASLSAVLFAAVLSLLIGGFAGHWFGSLQGARVAEAAQLQVASLRAEATGRAVASLHGDLIALLRNVVDAGAIRAPLLQAQRSLDEIAATLQAPSQAPSRAVSLWPAWASTFTGGPAPAATLPRALAQLDQLRRGLGQLADDQARAQAGLRAVAFAAERASGDQRDEARRDELARDVGEQRAGLAGLYAELAGEAMKAGHPDRARRLVATAARLDPSGRARYERLLQAPAASSAPSSAPTPAPLSPPSAASPPPARTVP
jgi:proteasome lid subunit RPN8/RPN11